MSLNEKQRGFIGSLLFLAREGKEDRGALADLRSGLSKKPGEMARVHKYVVPYLPDKNDDDRWYYLTATLFGLFPKHQQGRSLGAAFLPLRQKSETMEARFLALLNAHSDDLGDHLRHAVRLLKANEQPVDWFLLFDDLLQWDHPEGRVQLRWARDFYKVQDAAPSDPAKTNGGSLSQEEDHE